MVHVAWTRFYFRVVLDSACDNEYFKFGLPIEQNDIESTKRTIINSQSEQTMYAETRLNRKHALLN
jgi:hypothetical protein